MAIETGPTEKSLRVVSFAIQVTRGLLQDQSARRKIMFALLALAVLMLGAGTTFFSDTLDHHVHAAWFILYWLACGWLTVTALLLALFDVLILRAQAREARRVFKDRLK